MVYANRFRCMKIPPKSLTAQSITHIFFSVVATRRRKPSPNLGELGGHPLGANEGYLQSKFRSKYLYLTNTASLATIKRMSFAILRTAKLTTAGNVGGSAAHNFRERQTLNADPERTPQNVTYGAQTAKEVIAGVKARLATVPTVRKNAVLAIEYFIGASPEWFKEQSSTVREAYFDEAEKWLKRRHGVDNVIAFTRQYDETSPHVCAYVVPIDPNGRLNCSHFLNGRTKLSEMQTEFAETVGRQFQLNRGIEGSKAKHQTLKQYYAKIQAPTPELKTRIPEVSEATFTEKMAESVGIATDHSRALEHQEAARQHKEVEFRQLREAEQAKAKQYDVEKAGNKAREQRLVELRATATQARNLPLTTVLERLGCTPEPNDQKNWRTPIGRVSVDGQKFYAHGIAKGGGGAIDLVKLVEDMDYVQAVARLVDAFGSGAVEAQTVADAKWQTEAIALKPRSPYVAPKPEPENWPRVRKYLTEVRRLSVQLVDKVNEVGRLYADRYSNVVFVLNQGIGVELRGTGDKPFHGVRGLKAVFMLASRGEKSVAFVESAIDAMSLHELGFKGYIASTTGNSPELAKAMAEHYHSQGYSIIAAFDNDRAGEQMTANLGNLAERMRPTGKDWNDDLKAARPTADELRMRKLAKILAQDKPIQPVVKPDQPGPKMRR